MRKTAPHILVLIFSAFMFAGCSKGNLDKELNYNPFDPEYVGDSPFVFISVTTITDYTVFPPIDYIQVQFTIDESYFTSQPAFYRVRISENQNWEGFDSQVSNSEGLFEYEYPHPPESDCIYVALENGLSVGRQFSLCFEL